MGQRLCDTCLGATKQHTDNVRDVHLKTIDILKHCLTDTFDGQYVLTEQESFQLGNLYYISFTVTDMFLT